MGNHVTANRYRRHDHYKSMTTNKKGKKGKRKKKQIKSHVLESTF
jgi:ribosomal protein S21